MFGQSVGKQCKSTERWDTGREHHKEKELLRVVAGLSSTECQCTNLCRTMEAEYR